MLPVIKQGDPDPLQGDAVSSGDAMPRQETRSLFRRSPETHVAMRPQIPVASGDKLEM